MILIIMLTLCYHKHSLSPRGGMKVLTVKKELNRTNCLLSLTFGRNKQIKTQTGKKKEGGLSEALIRVTQITDNHVQKDVLVFP